MFYRSKNVKEAREKEGRGTEFNPAHFFSLASFTNIFRYRFYLGKTILWRKCGKRLSKAPRSHVQHS
jgi:hypothetical protein